MATTGSIGDVKMIATDQATVNGYVGEMQQIMNDKVKQQSASGIVYTSAAALRDDAAKEFGDRHKEIAASQVNDIAWEAGNRLGNLTAASGKGPLPLTVRLFAPPKT